jgi:hypothetical protein
MGWEGDIPLRVFRSGRYLLLGLGICIAGACFFAFLSVLGGVWLGAWLVLAPLLHRSCMVGYVIRDAEWTIRYFSRWCVIVDRGIVTKSFEFSGFPSLWAAPIAREYFVGAVSGNTDTLFSCTYTRRTYKLRPKTRSARARLISQYPPIGLSGPSSHPNTRNRCICSIPHFGGKALSSQACHLY